jgi:hypothetical protein
MKFSKYNLLQVASAGLLFGSPVWAQGHSANATPSARLTTGTAKSAAKVSTSSRGVGGPAVRSGHQATAIHLSTIPENQEGFAASPNSLVLDVISGVPGLGFDFPHLAAINGVLHGNSSPRFGKNGHHGGGSFIPVFFGGYPYYSDDAGYDQSEAAPEQQTQPQPQIIIIQQPAPASRDADTASNMASDYTAENAQQAAVAVPDVGDFILVRRDGRILFASIFSIVGAQLQYVTPEGIRHSLAMSDLDPVATQQMNEARGTTVRIQN